MSYLPPETALPALGSVRRSQSVRVRLLALLGTSLLIMFIIIGFSMYFLLFRFEQGMWQDRQREATRYSEKISVAFLDNIQNSLNSIATLEQERLEAQPEVMQSLLREHPELLEIIRLDEKGQVLASAYQEVPELTNLFTIAQSEWFAKARSGQHYLGDVQISSKDQPYTIVALPAAGGGVVAARLSMNVLWDLMSDIRFGATGTGYMIDQDGRIVAHSNPDIVLASTQIDLPPASSANSSEPYTNFAGMPVVGIRAPVQGTDWILVSEVSQAEAFGTTRSAPWLITGGLVVLGAVTIFFTARLLDRIILHPLKELQVGAARLGQGDLDYRLSIVRSDEVGQAATVFNQMADELSDMLNSLEMRVEMRTAQVQASADVGRAATSILDPDQLLQQVVQLIAERFAFYYAAVFTVDSSGQWALLREASGPGNTVWQLKQTGYRLVLEGDSMVAACIRNRRARVALDVGAEAIVFANPLLPDTRSEVALPLIVGDQVLGALDVHSTQAAAFDETSAAVLQNMADQIAVALNNAAQYRLEQNRAQQTTYLLEATFELTTQTQVTELYTRIIDLAEALLRSDCAALWLPVGEIELELQTASGPLHALIGQRLAAGEGVAGRVYATGLALQLDNIRAWEGATLDFGDAPVSAALATPMIWQGRPIGVLVAAQTLPDKVFTADDGSTAKLFATQAASAIENVRLLERLQQTLNELSRANKRLTGEAWQERLRDSEITYQHQRAGTNALAEPALSVAVPIELRGHSIGQVVVEDEQPQRQLSADEQQLVQEIVGRMALALESARLFEQTQAALGEARRLAQRERLINRITAQVRGAVTVDEVLRIAVNEMRHSVGAAYAAAQLTPPTQSNSGQGEDDDSK